MNTANVIALFEALDLGGLAIASTRRLARQAEQRYGVWKLEAGAGAWPTPRIRVFDDWLQEIWQAAFEHVPAAPRLLTEDQELLLWEQVIRRRPTAGHVPALLQLSGTARAARRTWSRIHEWQLSWSRIRAYRSTDTEAFVDWAAAVSATLADRNWLTPAQLPGRLAEQAAEWLDGQGRPAWWLGFDAMPPATRDVLAVLDKHGFEQKRISDAGIDDAEVTVVACDDARDEWRDIARWARAELATNPRATLGVVCPDLHRRRDEVEEILDDILHPEASRVDAPRVFHLSLGRPLPEYPIIGSALDLLRWTGRRIPFDVISRTLRSPYVGPGDDLEARVDFEVMLRSRRQESFTIAFLVSLAGERPGLGGFIRLLETARSLDPPGRADPGGWSGFFSDWLNAFNWPGARALDSHEFQALNAWREQLSRFAGLDTIQDRWTLFAALKQLSGMASARILQFHDDQAPLQIMGASESAGLWFDKLWLADMNDTVWPPPAQPDPFIPVPLQKDCGMPDACAQSVLAHTRARTAGLLASARQVTVSCAAERSDSPESLSPLFSELRPGEPGMRDPYRGRIDQLAGAAPPLDRVDDHCAPPPDEGELRGGVALVADQARCPFRALAHHRLHARDLDEVAPGLDAGTRGTLVHDALKRLWDRLQDRDGLMELEAAQLDRLVAECAAGALAREYADSAFQQRLIQIEEERLARLLREWLALEKQRQWFRVAGTETAMHVELGDVRFPVRVDRIDELADGRRLIIDYKTGRLTAIGDWVAPRMEEPQLPLYALGVEGEVAALALAAVRRGECELRGVTDNVEDLPSLKPVSELGFKDMAGLRSWWESVLGDLIGEYRDGIARVDPRSAQTCRHCDVTPLCRIFERGETAG